MIDIILVGLFCYQLQRMARERGLAALPYVLNYLAVFFLMMMGFGFLLITYYGPEIVNTPEGIKTAMMFEPFAILFEILLFIFFRRRIQKASVSRNDEGDYSQQPTKEKKDLSYFR